MFVPGIRDTTYSFGAPKYNSLDNNSTCTVGACWTFTTAMNVTGTFTTASPLPANLTGQNIAAQITSYSFSDGLDTFSGGNPNARVCFPGIDGFQRSDPWRSSTSSALAPAGTFIVPPVTVPTLSECGLIVLAGMLPAFGWLILRRRAA
jgi:hypothetical protein